MKQNAIFHLPGLFEFYEFYKQFLPLYFENKSWFYDWCSIGSIYGAPSDCVWGGGRTGFGENNIEDEILSLCNEFNISARLTFSNSLITEKQLSDKKCNALAEKFCDKKNGIIICSETLLEYLKKNFSDYYFVSSTTKVITDENKLLQELNRPEFKFVVPDFRFNNNFKFLDSLTDEEKNKMEFLCNECCWINCKQRKKCYENVSAKVLGLNVADHVCSSPFSDEGYVFSRAKKSSLFIGNDLIKNTYLNKGFSNFKIEGRSLGSALLLEFILHYLTKSEYELEVREKLYLNNSLDLF